MDAALEKRLKRQIIGKLHRFLAIAPLGFEDTLAKELAEFEIEQPQVTGDGKVEFTAKITDAWKAVAYSRIANRILMHIADFKAENFREFEKKTAEIPWELYLSEADLSIHVTCKHSRLYHSDAIAERLQQVIPSPVCSHSGNQHFLPERHSDVGQNQHHSSEQHLYINFLDDRCTIWLDLAGEELYKRGHERFVNDAPLKETIAAGMLFEATHLAPDYKSFCLFDLMAGSGTFSLEAAYTANKLIPGVCRDFALKHQPAFKEATWNYIVNKKNNDVIASAQREAIHNPIIHKIITSDISERAIEIIRHNVECSPLAGTAPAPIVPELKDFFSYTAQEILDACSADASLGETFPIIVLNPPYGKRLDFDAPKLYTNIGRRLAELARPLKAAGKPLTVAILAPKDDSRPGSKYTCSTNLLRECPTLSPKNNPNAKQIITSHGGITLNIFIAQI